jgi:lipoprotein-anchoring transpeptidase ErfK/SrfK
MRYLSRTWFGVAGCSLILASGLALAAGKAPGHIKKGAGGTIAEPSYTDSGPEPLLARVFDAIEADRLDLAMQQTDMLIKAYPNFRLAHLVKGDLLLARSRHLTAFGEGGGPAAGDKVADLRDEAIVRLKGYRSKPPADYVPRYLLQMHPEQKHAVVVDTQKSRLYLYQNDNGTPRFVADYYISQGKLGAEKAREGDKKTPIGVYHVTSSLPRQKLTDFYGSGAFPINYPNEWDKRQGRNGHGIWLHGTPSDTFSRPPKASDGCVVLANQDLDSLAKSLQVGLTPVIISNSIEWLSLDDWQNERSSLLKNDRGMAAGLGKPQRRQLRAALLAQVQFGRPGLPRMDRAQTQGQRGQELDQGRHRQHQHVPQSRQRRIRRRHLRAGLPLQQPFQPDEEAPVLDQGRRPLEDCF